MNQLLSILVTIARLAGTKLPLIWPHLLHIASDLKEIALILGVQLNDNPSFMESAESAELIELCNQNGCSEDECKQLVLAANAVDEKLDEADEG